MCSADVIDTPRLKLRPLTAADARRVAALADDLQVARMTSALPHPYRSSDAEAFIATQGPGSPERTFAIESREDGLIGVIGFRPAREAPWPELGYWLGRPYWGAGLATEAARGALAWAHRDWGKRAVIAGHFADNPASGRVLEKAGFLYTGDRESQLSTARGEAAELRRMAWLA